MFRNHDIPRLICVLALLFFTSALLSATPAPDSKGAKEAYGLGVDLQTIKDYWGALEQYQIAHRADPTFAPAIKQMGDCYYLLGDPAKAREAYGQYLALNPADSRSQGFYQFLATRVAAGTEPPPPLNPDGEQLEHNPRDHKRLMFQNELLTPIVFGLDASFFFNRRHNLGIGLTIPPLSGSGGSSIPLLHPRYRYYQAKWYWSPFFELGGLYWSGSSGGLQPLSSSIWAGDLGFGVNMINKGSSTVEFLLTLTGGILNTQANTSSGVVNLSAPFVIPLVGFGWGAVF
jgi:tetratricopeptide (TPR) repeat protein